MPSNEQIAGLKFILSANDQKFAQQMKGVRKDIKGVEETFKSMAVAMGLAFGINELKGLGQSIIRVTGEFQRFEAVLTNTLGSKSLALSAMKDIKDFAAATPFEVNELTASFVKLANQGFSPTTIELRKLGDLASSVGKSFDQLTEAIIDAQTGEFERLKEFGIRASKQGDEVTFTFKGVQTQTKFTSDAIREYILSLGDLKGVSGSMAAISETLEGRISNLNDAWGQLLVTIGQASSGPLFGAVKFLSDAVNTIQLLPAFFEQFKTGFSGMSNSNLDAILQFADTDTGKSIRDVLKPILDMDNAQFFAEPKKSMAEFVKLLTDEGEDETEVLALWNRYLGQRIESTKLNAEKEAKIRKDNFQKSIADSKTAFKLGEEAKTKLLEAEEKKRAAAHAAFFKSYYLSSNTEDSDLPESMKSSLFNNPQLQGLLDQDTKKMTDEMASDWEDAYHRMTLADNDFLKNFKNNQKDLGESTQKWASIAIMMGESIGTMFVDMADGTMSAAQAIGRATSGMLKHIGRVIMAEMVLAAIKDKTTSFSFFAKLALIGVAFSAGAAILSRLGANSGGSGGYGQSAPSARGADMNIRGEFRLQGSTLVAGFDKANYSKTRI